MEQRNEPALKIELGVCISSRGSSSSASLMQLGRWQASGRLFYAMEYVDG